VALKSEYTEALNYFEKQSNKSGIAQCRLKLGRISLETGDVNSARSILHSAMDYALQVGDKSTEATIDVELARIEWKEGHRAEAIVHLERARGFAEANQERPLLIKILQQLSKAHEAVGEFEASLAKLKKAVHLSAEVNLSETTARLHDMEMNRKFELLERENRLMEIENQLALAEVRRRISSDLHDDIGAALSGFSIISAAIRNKIMQGHLDDAMDSIDKIGEESRELLERLSDIVWATNPKNDQFDQLVSRLQNYAVRMCAGKNIELQFSADTSLAEVLLALEVRSNLFLILKEAINNAVKYSCATLLIVSVQRNENSIMTRVDDNGHGFDVLAASEGNGLRNMKQRATLIRANFDLQSTSELGTRIVLEIPL
jgi:signal transduction histidine kinase